MKAGRRVFLSAPLLRNEARASHPPRARPRSDVTVITASLPVGTSVLAEAIASVAAQTAPCAHLIAVDHPHGVAEVRTGSSKPPHRVGRVPRRRRPPRPDHLETLLAHAGDADVVIPHCRFDGPPLPAGYCNRPYDRARTSPARHLPAHRPRPPPSRARRRRLPRGRQVRGLVAVEPHGRPGARFVVVPKETWTYRTVTADRRTEQLVSA
jgi:hypothetical protein